MTLFSLLLVLGWERLFKLGEHWQLEHRLRPVFRGQTHFSMVRTGGMVTLALVSPCPAAAHPLQTPPQPHATASPSTTAAIAARQLSCARRPNQQRALHLRGALTPLPCQPTAKILAEVFGACSPISPKLINAIWVSQELIFWPCAISTSGTGWIVFA